MTAINKFHNYLDGTNHTECCAQHPCTRWFITPGFAGYNSPTNNHGGYVSKAWAETTCLRYQEASTRASKSIAYRHPDDQ